MCVPQAVACRFFSAKALPSRLYKTAASWQETQDCSAEVSVAKSKWRPFCLFFFLFCCGCFWICCESMESRCLCSFIPVELTVVQKGLLFLSGVIRHAEKHLCGKLHFVSNSRWAGLLFSKCWPTSGATQQLWSFFFSSGRAALTGVQKRNLSNYWKSIIYQMGDSGDRMNREVVCVERSILMYFHRHILKYSKCLLLISLVWIDRVVFRRKTLYLNLKSCFCNRPLDFLVNGAVL